VFHLESSHTYVCGRDLFFSRCPGTNFLKKDLSLWPTRSFFPRRRRIKDNKRNGGSRARRQNKMNANRFYISLSLFQTIFGMPRNWLTVPFIMNAYYSRVYKITVHSRWDRFSFLSTMSERKNYRCGEIKYHSIALFSDRRDDSLQIEFRLRQQCWVHWGTMLLQGWFQSRWCWMRGFGWVSY